MTLGSNLLLSFFCPFLIHFTIVISVGCLQKNYSPSFCGAGLTPTVCCPLHIPVPMDTSCHLAPAASIPADVLHSLCMLAMNSPFCMWFLEQGLSCQPQKGIASGCKRFCHLLHRRLQPCQCHRGDIASDCSTCPEVDALSPERNAPLTPGCIFNSAWALAALYQN